MDSVDVLADGMWYMGVVVLIEEDLIKVKFAEFEPEILYWPEGRRV